MIKKKYFERMKNHPSVIIWETMGKNGREAWGKFCNEKMDSPLGICQKNARFLILIHGYFRKRK